MAAEFTQLPAELGITFVSGDEVNIALDFSNDLTGHTFQNAIYVSGNIASGGGGSGFVNSVGETVASFTITQTNLSSGQIGIGLTESQTSQLSPANSYRWYLRWVSPGNVTRTVLSGPVTPVAP
jgi:hypothetical protein